MTPTWAIGVTTTLKRRNDLFPRTLASLRDGGFDRPRIFVDGCNDPSLYRTWEGYEVTLRCPQIGAMGNWILSLGELLIRNPKADRFAIFQDDILSIRNLRQYLDTIELEECVYWCLYAWESNEKIAPNRVGFYDTHQFGHGAQGLVFSRECVITLLSHEYMLQRPLAARWPDRNIDGAVVTALKKEGYREQTHSPSLLQHTGEISTIKAQMRHPQSKTFPGETFDAMEWMKK